ncbi:MAG: type VI secretion system tip protein TssI/VgrG [Enhygromyxa sp.]
MSELDDLDRVRAGRLHPVAFDFWWPQRPEVNWQVLGLRGTEALSDPYRFEIELLCDDPLLDPDELLGADGELLLDRNGLTRTLFGIVAQVDLLLAPPHPRDSEGVGVRVVLVPAFAMLEHELDTRFFMGQTVLEILAEVLGPALAAWGRELDLESRITGQYPRRDYCVQFRESTFDFCSRLMQEEGIAYVFVPEHDNGRETMILVDDNAGYAESELLIPGPVPIVATASEELERESIQVFEWHRERTPNRVIARGYNLKHPGRLDSGQAERHDRGRSVVAEQQLDGDQRQIIDDPVDDPEATQFTGEDLEQQAASAARALQRHTLAGLRGHGRSNAIGFGAGGLFELAEPLAAIAEQQFLIVKVEHHGHSEGGLGSSELAYHNRFACLPKSQPFRPARQIPKPRVYGVQTGVVVGRSGDEVYTDPLGRIRVEFHRDRERDGPETKGEHASCWIRVAQMWAGKGYGAMLIPRVGMEVVVSFVDGDPDRPLVTGTVYNGANTPPYPLPNELSKATLKTRSTPGGEGFNELRIEDQDGREQIFVHAQRRMDLRVRGCLYQTSVGGREEVIGPMSDPGSVSHNVLVNGDVNHHVVGERSTWIEACDYRITGWDRIDDIQNSHYAFVADLSQLNATRSVVEATEHLSRKARTLELAGSSTISVKGGDSIVLQSNNRVELVCGQSFIALTPTAVEIGGESILLNSGGGAVGRATDGQATIETVIWDPADALVADDGRLRSGGGGRGRGSGRQRDKSPRHLVPRHAPPMEPMKPTRPGGAPKTEGQRRIVLITWAEPEAWCSEPTPVWVNSEGYDGSTNETLIIDNQVDGATQCVDVVRPAAPTESFAVEITDVIPRRIGATVESERELVASLVHAKTPTSIRFRFVSELPRIRYTRGYARFDLSVSEHEVTVGGTIEFTRGWIYYIIRLDKFVPEDTGGRIGGKYYGSTDWRYCKRKPTEDGALYVYWDGTAWVDVPDGWSSPLGTRRYGMAVWREGDKIKTQFGKLAWPDPVPDTWSDEWEGEDWVPSHMRHWAMHINQFWTGKLDLERNECRGHQAQCCRYPVRCEVGFKETDRHAKGIIVAQNYARANASVWPYDTSPVTLAHEFGHHLGNPDEYPGATSVDPTVNGDGAKAGIDSDSIMGSGELIRRRHFDTVCKAMAQAVAEHTGKVYSYKAVVPVGGPR